MFTRENIEDELNRLLNDRRNKYVLYDLKKPIVDFLLYLQNIKNENKKVSYNVLIVDNNFARSGELCEHISMMMEKMFGNGCGLAGADITEWYAAKRFWAGNHRFFENVRRFYPAITGIVFRDVTKQDCQGEMWDKLVAEFRKDDTTNLVKILCTNRETAKYLEENYEDIYYRYFPDAKHMEMADTKPDAICGQLLDGLKLEGFSVAAEFEKKIREYINIVYPKADLRENPFVVDLYGRVVRSVLSREGTEKTILEGDVPEYNKNDFLPDMNYEVKGDVEASINSDKKVAILLVPSTFNPVNKATCEYSRVGEKDAKKYNGIQTNDAPLQYLMDTVCKNGEKLEKVILLPSKEVMYKDVPELQSHTAYGRLCKLIHRYHSILLGRDESEDELDVKAIAIDYVVEQENGSNSPEKQVYKRIEATSEVVIPKSPRERLPQMFDELAKALSGCSKVYIDFTGGQRDMNFLMVAIIKFLQTTGLSCGEIIYSNINGQQRFLMDMDIQYQMFQLINATNEFLNTGSAKQLDDFFKPLDTACGEDADTESNPVKEVVELMKKYSEMINVCNLEKLDETVRKLVEKIEEFTKDESDNLYFQMFRSILPIIKERLYLDHVIDENDNKKVVIYPYIIKWCLDNDMLQQALTVYVECMPKYYFDKKIIPDTLAEIIFNMPENGKRRSPAEFFYETLFAKFMESDKLVQKYWNVRYDIEFLTRDINIHEELSEEVREELKEELKDKLKNGVLKYFTYKSVSGIEAKEICTNWFMDDVFSDNYDTLGKNAKRFDTIIRIIQSKKENASEAFGKIYDLGSKMDSTYDRKLQVIKNINEGMYDNHGIEGGRKFLHDIMLDYLLVKVLRNQMNHAGGNDEHTTNESSGTEQEESRKEAAQKRVLQYYIDYHKEEKITEAEMFTSPDITEIIKRAEIEKVIAFLERSVNQVLDNDESIVWNEAEAESTETRSAKLTAMIDVFNPNGADKYTFTSTRCGYGNSVRRKGKITKDNVEYDAIMPKQYMKPAYSNEGYNSMENVSIKRIEGDHFIVYKQ